MKTCDGIYNSYIWVLTLDQIHQLPLLVLMIVVVVVAVALTLTLQIEVSSSSSSSSFGTYDDGMDEKEYFTLVINGLD